MVKQREIRSAVTRTVRYGSTVSCESTWLQSGMQPRWSIIESTLREGEQFVNAFFTTQQKIDIARMLDDFGVEYIELTSPAASPQSFDDAKTIASLGLRCKTLTHTRCTMEDAKLAVDAGVDGIDVLFGTSSYLREFSHGKDMEYIISASHLVSAFSHCCRQSSRSG